MIYNFGVVRFRMGMSEVQILSMIVFLENAPTHQPTSHYHLPPRV